MRKTIQAERGICDFCNKAETYQKCLNCRKDVCWECKKKQGIEYSHGVYFQGSGDGFYCTPGDITLSENGNNLVHRAYVEIRNLRDEQRRWGEAFEKRRQAAEEALNLARSGCE